MLLAGTFKKLELPALEEGFSRLYYARIQDGRFIVTPWQEEKTEDEV